MKQFKIWLVLAALISFCFQQTSVEAQTIPEEKLIALTPEWNGQRFEDGRPKVSEDILSRFEHVSHEEVWGTLIENGYHNQFVGGEWEVLRPDQPIIGRALTATYFPERPAVKKVIDDQGKRDGRSGPQNTWPIDVLQQGDVYVADGYGKVEDGTLIGDRLGNTIYANSGNGVVFHGSSRDREGLLEISGFNAFVRAWDPSIIREMMLMGLNTPTRIGSTTVMPGDVVLAKGEGVTFIPAHLAETVVLESEKTRARDTFAHERVQSGTYTAGQMDTDWTQQIQEDFKNWVRSNSRRLKNELGVSQETIDILTK